MRLNPNSPFIDWDLQKKYRKQQELKNRVVRSEVQELTLLILEAELGFQNDLDGLKMALVQRYGLDVKKFQIPQDHPSLITLKDYLTDLEALYPRYRKAVADEQEYNRKMSLKPQHIIKTNEIDLEIV